MKDSEGGKPDIVLVVDEALLRMHAADLLEDAGYRVVEATDAASALRILEDRPEIRVLFTDIQMPGEDDAWLWLKKSTRGGRMSFCFSRLEESH